MSQRLSTLSKLKVALAEAGVRIIDESPAGGFSLSVEGWVFQDDLKD